jgi:hypothetical protein
MVGFFYVRKLIESRKLSRDFADRQITATAYPARGKHVHLMNCRRDLDELFDMSAPKQLAMKIEDLRLDRSGVSSWPQTGFAIGSYSRFRRETSSRYSNSPQRERAMKRSA